MKKLSDLEAPQRIANAWELIKSSINQHMLDYSDLPELIEHLKNGRDFASEEIHFDFIDNKLKVRFFEEIEAVDKIELIEFFKNLLRSQ